MMGIASIMSRVIPGTFAPDMSASEAPAIAPIPESPLHADATPATALVPSIGAVSGAGKSTQEKIGTPVAPSVSGDTSFKDTVKALLADVNDSINTSDANTRDLASGKTHDVNRVVTSVEEANMALQYTMAIRTKLLEAYTSIQSMSV